MLRTTAAFGHSNAALRAVVMGAWLLASKAMWQDWQRDRRKSAGFGESQRASAIGERLFSEGGYISQLLHNSPSFAFPSGYFASAIRRSVHRTRPPIAISC